MDPVYVYAPPWRATSAGIQVLHRLCHLLNQCGQSSWLVLSSPESGVVVSESLDTPVLTPAIAEDHFKAGQKPIVVYSETVPGNPLGASRVVRYLLNFPGALGGALSFPESETLIAYSGQISRRAGHCPVLFIPAVDVRDLPPARGSEPHLGKPAVYAAKYRAFVGSPDLSWIKDHVEIHRAGRARQRREDVLEILAQAPVLYCYENSTIATEATLMGTPVLFVRSAFMNSVIAEDELGRDGWGWSDELDALERARETLPGMAARYEEACRQVESRVMEMLPIIQAAKPSGRQLGAVHVPRNAILLSRHRMRLGWQTLRHLGPIALLRTTRDFLRRRVGSQAKVATSE